MEITFTLTQRRGRDGRRVPRLATPASGARIPRLSRLMALAIRFEGLIREGKVADQAAIARFGGVTRARLTQIMRLLDLAPDIQEDLLFLPGSSQLVERDIRPIVRLVSWDDQRAAFGQLRKQFPR